MRIRSFVPFLVLSLAALMVAFVPIPLSLPEPVERTIRIEADRFSYQPGVLHVNPGDLVTLEFKSTDVVHGLSLDGYDIELVSDPGQPSRSTFTANQIGVFRFRCSVACGDMHPFMIGKLQVGPNTLLWRVSGLAILASIIELRRWKL